MESHLAKYRSHLPALALIFHLTFHAHQGEFTAGCITPVSEFAANMAIKWCTFLEEHAGRVYAADISKNQHRAHALAKHLLGGDIADGETVRNVYRKQWTMLRTPEDVYGALSILEGLNWVRTETQETGGRPRDVIRINPDFTHEKFSRLTVLTTDKTDKSDSLSLDVEF
jgi:hypothetical protein